MRDFKELIVWEKAYALTLHIYNITSTFPKEEAFGLISQMRRSSTSIPANIAEGCGHDSKEQLNRFLSIAAGSAAELDCQIMRSYDLGFTTNSSYQILQSQITEVRKILFSFKRTLIAKSGLEPKS